MAIKWRRLDEKTYRRKVEEVIIRHEKDVPMVYLDPVGIPTVGPGKALVILKGSKWILAEGNEREGIDILEKTTGEKLTVEQRSKLEKAAQVLARKGRSDEAYYENAKEFYKKVPPINSKERTNPENGTFGVTLTK